MKEFLEVSKPTPIMMMITLAAVAPFVIAPGHILPTVLGWMFLGWVVFGGIVVMLRRRYMPPSPSDFLREGKTVGHPMKYESIPTYYELQRKYEQGTEEEKPFLQARLEQMRKNRG